MTAVFCQHFSDSAGGSVVNHRILGTGQREREQLLSATLPAIREPALAHGRGHTRERRLRGAALHAPANVTRSPQTLGHGRARCLGHSRCLGHIWGAGRHTRCPGHAPFHAGLLRLCAPGAGRGGAAPLRSVCGPRRALPLMLAHDTHPESFSAQQRLPE